MQVEMSVKVPFFLAVLGNCAPRGSNEGTRLRKNIKWKDRKSDQGKSTLLMVFFPLGENTLRYKWALPKRLINGLRLSPFGKGSVVRVDGLTEFVALCGISRSACASVVAMVQSSIPSRRGNWTVFKIGDKMKRPGWSRCTVSSFLPHSASQRVAD